ncbi:hypothetical protein [Amycolatopsis sp. NPDC058986]|uniref:hypothetical protein n=1 Tax=unclassified Amycolatopsis TaxID=2618356 RepID=UPI00366AE64C
MTRRSTIATVLGAGALTAGMLTGAAGPASATQVSPMGDHCSRPFCGTLTNNTSHSVKVCRSWGAAGWDGAYQPADKCKRNGYGYVLPHTTWGDPQNVDIDAFYIPPGTVYTGGDGGGSTGWSHQKSGWWKFSDLTHIYINFEFH